MAITLQEITEGGYRREWRENFRRYKQRAYRCGPAGTLANLGLERGDTLPDDATFEIIESRLETTRPGKARPGADRIAIVVGVKFDTE